MFYRNSAIKIIFILSCGITGAISRNADISDYPYHVSIEYNDSHSCSGALIVERWILTVAACVHRNGLTNLTVRVGTAVTSTEGKQLAVRSVYVHDDFDPIYQINDIALLELRMPLEYGVGRLPVILPNSGFDIAEGSIAVLTGWVMTSRLYSQLTVIYTPIINETICRSSLPDFKELTDSMLCAGYMTEDAELCQGDVGSPLVYGENLVGILSYGLGCIDPTYPVVYTNISDFITWIFNITGVIF